MRPPRKQCYSPGVAFEQIRQEQQ